MGEKGVGKLSRETPPPREGEPMGAGVSDTENNTDTESEVDDSALPWNRW